MQSSKFAILAMLLLTTNACTKKSNEASTATVNPIPSASTIVKDALPAILESSAAASVPSEDELQARSVDSNLQAVKDRLFSPGPTDFLYRLASVDTTLANLADAIKSCENTTTTTYEPPAVATGFSFPMEFSCVQSLTASSGVSDPKIYFGKSAGNWYVASFQSNSDFASQGGEPPSIAVLAKIAENGTRVEAYQLTVEQKASVYYGGIMHIIADKSTGEFEISTASSANTSQTLTPGANFSGLGCGVRMKTDGSKVYASGSFDQSTSCAATTTVCASATDLSTTTGCSAPLTTFSTMNLDRANVSGGFIKAVIIDRYALPDL